MKPQPCPNQPASGLQRLRGDLKSCPSPWICGKRGCQFTKPDGVNAETPHGRKQRSLRERTERINKLLKGNV